MTTRQYIARFFDNMWRGRPPFDFSPITHQPDAISEWEWGRATSVLEKEKAREASK